MKKTAKKGRPLGSKNKVRTGAADKAFDQMELEGLRTLSERQDHAIAQATDQIADLQAQVEFYRKQVNHFLALLNILAKGA